MADEKKYEGPVATETPGIPPNAAEQSPEQYVASRLGAIPQDVRAAMGFGANPEQYMHLELMFRQCFWKERHDMLERNAQAMIRHVLAGRAAVYAMCKEIMTDSSEKEIKEYADSRIEEQMGLLPEHFDAMPKL